MMTGNAARWVTSVATAACLLSNVGAQATGQDLSRARRNPAMSPREDAQLEARAAKNQELETFAAGQEGLGFIVLAPVVVVAAFVGSIVACPLGYSHSLRERGFIPGNCWDPDSKVERFFNRSAIVFGFPLYCMGYLMGLPFQTSGPAPALPIPMDPPTSRQGRDFLEVTVEKLTDKERVLVNRQDGLKIVAVRGLAEKAGLRPGDILLDLGGMPITEETLGEVLSRYDWGDTVEAVVLRMGQRIMVEVRFPERKD